MAQQRDENGKFLPSDKQPQQWAPRQEVGDGDALYVGGDVSGPEEAMRALGLDPAEWEVSGARSARWMAGEEWKQSSRYTFARKARSAAVQADVDELLTVVEAWRPGVYSDTPRGRYSAVVNLSDWQIGNGEGGGSRAAVERILRTGSLVTEYLRHHRPAELVVHGLGDLIENCAGYYDMQAFSTDLDLRAQQRTVWRTLAALLREWAGSAPHVKVVPVAGNHGENRANGKAFTSFGDNSDLTVFEIVRDVLDAREGFEHFEWEIPEDSLSVAHTTSGVRLGLTHGHLFRAGSNASAKAESWWKGQVFGYEPVADAKILVSGHFHHFSATEFAQAGRTHFQTPAMDGGSAWYTAASGKSSAPGTLVFLVGRDLNARGWDHLRIL